MINQSMGKQGDGRDRNTNNLTGFGHDLTKEHDASRDCSTTKVPINGTSVGSSII